MKSDLNDYDPRSRLVGAVVLVMIAVVFLPMLLNQKVEDPDAAGGNGGAEVMEITSQGKKIFVSKITPLETEAGAPASTGTSEPAGGGKTDAMAPDAAVKPAPGSALLRPGYVKSADEKAAPAPATKAPSPEQKRTGAEKPAAPAADKAAPAAAPAPSSTPTAVTESGWIVQVGLFSDAANVNKATGLLKKHGYTTRQESVKTRRGEATRVFLGPFSTREAADRILASVERSTGLKGFVATRD